MKKIFLSLILIIPFFANATIWRISNRPGVIADFTQIEAALNSTTIGKIVNNDDTLHVEPTNVAYSGADIDKRVVIIGNGYFLGAMASKNNGLQFDTLSSLCSYFYIDSLGSGSTFIGLEFNDGLYNKYNGNNGADNITVTRCKLNQIYFTYALPAINNFITSGWNINKCYVSNVYAQDTKMHNLIFTNNIMTGGLDISNNSNLNCLVRNNVIRGAVETYNTYFSNNLLYFSTSSFVNTTVKNNLTTGNYLPSGNGNLNNQSDASVFVGITGNSMDGQWQLKATSPAIGAGETIGGVTPDCGAYGTADPYRKSGIPNVPTIYSLSVPGSIPSTATTMPITISTRSNN